MADPIHGNKVTLSYEDIKTLLGGYTMRNIDMVNRVHHPLQHIYTEEVKG